MIGGRAQRARVWGASATGGAGGMARTAGTWRARGNRSNRARWGWACQKASQRPERCSARKLTTCWVPAALQRMPAPLVRACTTLLQLLSTAPDPMGKRRAMKAG